MMYTINPYSILLIGGEGDPIKLRGLQLLSYASGSPLQVVNLLQRVVLTGNMLSNTLQPH